MLARWSRSAARFLDIPLDSTGTPSDESEEVLIDFTALRELVTPVLDRPWKSIPGWASAPMYKSIKDTLSEDVEHLARILSDLHPPSEDDQSTETPVDEQALPTSKATSNSHNTVHEPFPGGIRAHIRPVRKRWKSLDGGLVIPSADPTIPTIIVTPCASQPRDTSCHVPLQDSAFGNRLTLPMHPTFNRLFPPHLPPVGSRPPSAHVIRWRYKGGHWHAVLPSLQEQGRRGIFSRAFMVRKKARVA